MLPLPVFPNKACARGGGMCCAFSSHFAHFRKGGGIASGMEWQPSGDQFAQVFQTMGMRERRIQARGCTERCQRVLCYFKVKNPCPSPLKNTLTLPLRELFICPVKKLRSSIRDCLTQTELCNYSFWNHQILHKSFQLLGLR